MRRRAFIAGLCSATYAAAAIAQEQSPRLHRVGILSLLRRDNEDAFRSAMHDLGYVEGKTVLYETRYAQGRPDRLASLAAELAAQVEIIVTAGHLASEAAKHATTTVPVVLWGAGDPVRTGLVPNLTQPGGNITGVTELSTELTAKRLQLFKEAIPGLRRVALLWSAGDRSMSLRAQEVEATAPSMALTLMLLPVRRPEDFEVAFEAMSRERPDGILVVTDAITPLKQAGLFEFARQQRLPTMFEFPSSVRDGGLLSYGASLTELARRAAAFVDRILKGANPADLPIEVPVRWHLAVNLRTAKALEVDVPATLLARADEVIE